VKLDKILSCSTCRSEAELNSGEDGFFVCCENLDNVSDSYPTEKEAIKAGDARPTANRPDVGM
jgi:hypothetical protein